MTYPEIGNVGVNREDVEARAPFVKGFIVKEYWDPPSSWRAEQSLGDYMRDHGIVGISGIDTRALVRHLRTHGAQEAIISTVDLDPARLVARAKARPGLVGRDLVREVTCAEAYDWNEPLWRLEGPSIGAPGGSGGGESRRSVSRRVRLRHQVQHPPQPRERRLSRPGRAGDDLGCRRARREARRRLSLERPRRSRRAFRMPATTSPD